MEICSICPKNGWEWMYEKPMVMLLAHFIEKHPDYTELAANRDPSIYAIVDNSIVEMGSSFSMERVYEAAKKVNANEIILEDSYPKGPETIESIKNSIQWLKDNNHIGKFKLQAVCHGENEDEFIKTFEFINSIPEIDVIGIPKVLSRWCGDRANMAKYFLNTDKEIHFLGNWFQLGEFLRLPSEVKSKVRSADTCMFALSVIQNKGFYEDRDGTIDLEADYDELTKEKYDELLKKFEGEFNV